MRACVRACVCVRVYMCVRACVCGGPVCAFALASIRYDLLACVSAGKCLSSLVMIAMIHEIPFIFTRCNTCHSYLRIVMEKTKRNLRSTFPEYMPIEMCKSPTLNGDVE